MTTNGTKQISYSQRKDLYRSTPRKIRYHNCAFVNTYRPLIESLTRDDYIEYEKLLHVYGTQGQKREVMLNKFIELKITGPKLELAKLRVENLYHHQKIMISIRNRWTKIEAFRKEKFNSDIDKMWNRIATGIQARCQHTGYELYSGWQGSSGKVVLIDHLKDLYEKQNKCCAISKEQIVLQAGDKTRNPNKCSPDRKSSNKGYVPGNVWLVAWWVNVMKMDTSLITFWKRIDTLAEVRKLNKKVKVNG